MKHDIKFIYDYTEDGLRLQGTLYNALEKDICVILIHGMCGTIIDNYFATKWGEILSENNIGFIYGHTRGHSIENDIITKDGTFERCGCMYEIFEECIYDINLWIKKVKELGYKRIVLAGHSFGCNKVIYYINKCNPDIEGVILASAPDMHGFNVARDNNYDRFIKEAKSNIDNGESKKLLSEQVDNYMYMSSATYYNWFNKDSNVDVFPILRNPKRFEQLEKVKVPILTFSGENEEDLYLKMNVLKEKATNCPDFEYKVINNSGHLYASCEETTGNLILNWLKNKFEC